MSQVTHRLKTVNPFFTESWEERKPFELRYNDRNYQVGDFVMLYEYGKETNPFSGRIVTGVISYVLHATQFPDGLREGYVVFGLQRLSYYSEQKIPEEMYASSPQGQDVYQITEE